MADLKLQSIIEQFSALSGKPAKFLSVQNDDKDEFKNLLKTLYDFTKQQEKGLKKENKGALPELIVEDFDEEQIWQEIELQNTEVKDQLVWDVANCISKKDDLSFPIIIGNNQADEEMENENVVTSETEVPKKSNTNTDKTKLKKTRQKFKSTSKPSIVDDQFFKLQEMEQFLLKEERNDGKKVSQDSDEESIDLFDEVDGDSEEEQGEGARDVKYYDFFDQDNDEGRKENDDQSDQENDDEDIENDEQISNDQMDSNDELDDNSIEDKIANENSGELKKTDKKVRFADASSSDDDSGSDVNDIVADNKTVEKSNEKKSEFEMRQERMKKQIEKLEENMLNEAPWQLKGEVDATKRPQNSLLEEVVDFDLTSRPAPIITEQTTFTLEDIIKQRIKDKAWDDVQKKEKPVDDQLNFRKTEILDHSKSKLSLAQVYEAEYLKQKHAASGDVEEEKEPEAHTQIREAMSQLFAKLDALCHYHYTPRAAQAEVKIVSNTPAISMEEVAPVATSDAALLAPEEVKKKQRGDLMTKEERTQTDKNRERRKKKKLQRAKGGHVMKVTDHRNTKKGTEANDKSLKTSKAFFTQLNEETTSLIKKNKNSKLGKIGNK